MNTATEQPVRPRVALPAAPPPARPARAWHRLGWLAGIALLTASLVGANHVLNSRATADGPSKVPAERSFSGPPGVVCLGTVDLEDAPGGYVPLMPVQLGEVTEVPAVENQTVKKGDVLLRVDGEAQAQTVAQAETGVKLAQAQVTEAQQGVDQHRAAVEGQTAAVSAAKHKINAAEYRLNRQKYLLNITAPTSNQDEINAATEELNAAKSGLAGEEGKLRAMEANKPDVKVREAEDNVTLARQRADQARLALKRCTLEAPADGTILRVTVSRGSVLGPQTRQAPVLFAPTGPRVVRAEVEQEFAHRVQVGMAATIQDEVNGQVTWQGKVKRLGAAFLPKRSIGPESLGLGGSDGRVLECLVELDPNQPLPMLGQRVRVSIGTHGGS